MAKGRIVSPTKFLGAALGAVGGIMNLVGGKKASAEAAKKQRLAQAEMDKQKQLMKI